MALIKDVRLAYTRTCLIQIYLVLFTEWAEKMSCYNFHLGVGKLFLLMFF